MDSEFDDALSIVQTVLVGHNVVAEDDWQDGTPPEWLDVIAVYLVSAGEGESVRTPSERNEKSQRELRETRISLIEDLLATYREPGDRIQTRKWLRERHSNNLDAVLRRLKALQHTEKLLNAKERHDLRRGRPLEAKNESATGIYQSLCEAGIVSFDKSGAWKGAGLIGEMLIEAGIDNRSHDSVQRYLYEQRLKPLLLP